MLRRQLSSTVWTQEEYHRYLKGVAALGAEFQGITKAFTSVSLSLSLLVLITGLVYYGDMTRNKIYMKVRALCAYVLRRCAVRGHICCPAACHIPYLHTPTPSLAARLHDLLLRRHGHHAADAGLSGARRPVQGAGRDAVFLLPHVVVLVRCTVQHSLRADQLREIAVVLEGMCQQWAARPSIPCMPIYLYTCIPCVPCVPCKSYTLTAPRPRSSHSNPCTCGRWGLCLSLSHCRWEPPMDIASTARAGGTWCLTLVKARESRTA
jgi:hypothetical protein